MKKSLFKTCSLLFITCLSTGVNAQEISPIICQNKTCLPANQAVTKDHLFEHINYLLEKNINSPITICEADVASKSCLKKGASIPIVTNNVQTSIDLLSARLIDIKKVQDSSGIDLIVDYKTKSGNIFPSCQTAYSRLGVLNNNAIQVIAPEFSCKLTQTTPSSLSLIQYIDYINFDTGTIGAHYISSNAVGQNKIGYLLLQFDKQAYFSSHPAFPMPEVVQQVQQKNPEVAHTQVSPVWMKPTPILNLEKPTFVDQDCMHTPHGCQNLELNTTLNPQQNLQSPTPSTTGLIEQDKVILPPTNGIRKTITTRKQIIEDGKPVAIEENIVHYVQENPNMPLQKIEPSTKEKETEKSLELPNPQMPKTANPITPVQQQFIPEYYIPQEIVLSPAEIETINKVAPIEQPQKESIAEQKPVQIKEPVVIQDHSLTKEEPTSFLDRLEKYFYF